MKPMNNTNQARPTRPPRPDTKGVLGRLMKLLFADYKKELIVVAVCIVLTAIASTIASVFMNFFINTIGEGLELGWDAISRKIYIAIGIMISIYAVGWVTSYLHTRIMAIVTQGFLNKMRKRMFKKMEELPLRYFDTNPHGDIMSHYTNDIDTMRELISRTIPHIISAILTISMLIFYMIWLSVWMAFVVAFATVAMVFVTKKIGGNSAKHFIKMQRSIAKTEGFVEEMMEGQKVVKVFCHEDTSEKDFDAVNEQLCRDATNANRFANILMPIMGNIGNILYVLVAFVGGLLIISGSVKNVSLSGQAMGIAVVVPFLNMTKQFTNNVTQVSQQINAIVMAMAGSKRVFELLDQQPEADDGYVVLVNCREQNGEIVECEERTGSWAWKHRHGDGSVTYIKFLRGQLGHHLKIIT